jgi:hypothetical protein
VPYTFNNQTKIIRAYLIPSLSKQLYCGMDFWRTFEIEIAIKEGAAETIQAEDVNENEHTDLKNNMF